MAGLQTPDVTAGNMPAEVMAYIKQHPQAQLYHTEAWARTILNEVGGEIFHVVSRRNGQIAGCMAVYLKDGPVGLIANSAPYFGSHGGILANDEDAFDAVAEATLVFLRERKVRCLNLIEPLSDPYRDRYGQLFPVVAGTRRIGHVKNLSNLQKPDALLESLGGLARSNLKRKCWRAGITVGREEDEAAVDWLLQHHIAQMTAKGAAPKKRSFFEAWQGWSDADGNPASRLYIARQEGRPVAGLYLRTWREWVEYLTPVFDLDCRQTQPLTAVIFGAMLDCARDGFQRWNFGGSGADLSGVKAFKEHWGGDNIEYRYHLVDLGGANAVREHALAAGAAHYPGYFLYPLR